MKRTSFLVNKLLKESRQAALMSQRDLAEYCNLGKAGAQSISNYERNLCPVPLKALKKIVEVLDVDENKVAETYALDTRRNIMVVLESSDER